MAGYTNMSEVMVSGMVSVWERPGGYLPLLKRLQRKRRSLKYFKIYSRSGDKINYDCLFDLAKVNETNHYKMWDPHFKRWNRKWDCDFEWFNDTPMYFLLEITEQEAFIEIL